MFAKLGFFVTVCFSIILLAQEINYDAGIEHIQSKDYKKAQEIFIVLIEQDHNNAELWYQLGLSYRFQKNFKQAKLAQEKAYAIDPKKLESVIELARLNLWLGDRKLAKQYLDKVLSIDPTNEEALQLKNKSKKDNNQSYKGDIALGYQYSIIGRSSQVDWKQQYVHSGYWLSPKINLHGKFENYERFNEAQQLYGIGTIYRYQENLFNFELIKGFKTSFLPRTRLKGDIDLKLLDIRSPLIKAIRLLIYNQYDQYSSLDIGIVKPGIKAVLFSGLELFIQHIWIINQNQKSLHGVSSRIDWFSQNELWHVFLGFSYAPETDNAIIIDTTAVYFGGRYKIKDDLDIILNYSHETREASFLRDVIGLTVRKKF